MFRRSKPLVGLDFGSSALKMVELSGAPGARKLLAYDREPLPEGVVVAGHIADTAAAATALRALLNRRRSRTMRVAAALPASAVVMKRIRVPAMSEEELAASIVWEAANYVAIEPDEMNVDFKLLPSDQEGDADTMSVLLVAARKDAARRLVRVILDAGATPAVIDAVPFALQNIYEANYRWRSGSVAVLIDAGALQTTINVATAGEPLMIHQIVGGAEDVVAVLRQLLATTDRTNGFDTISEVILSGGRSLQTGFAETLREIAPAVTWLDPFRRVGTGNTPAAENGSEWAAVFSVAAGLALRRSGDRWSS